MRWAKITDLFVSTEDKSKRKGSHVYDGAPEESHAFLQLEFCLAEFFDQSHRYEFAASVEAWYKDEQKGWPAYHKKWNSCSYFVFPMEIEKGAQHVHENQHGWQHVCDTLIALEPFQRCAFLILRGFSDPSLSSVVSGCFLKRWWIAIKTKLGRRHPKIELPQVTVGGLLGRWKRKANLFGYELDPAKFYNLELIQYVPKPLYDKLDSGEIQISLPPEAVRFVESKLNVLYCGKYRVHYPLVFTRSSFRTSRVLLGVNCELKLRQRRDRQAPKKQVTASTKQEAISSTPDPELLPLSPSFVVPLTINATRNVLYLAALFIVSGFVIGALPSFAEVGAWESTLYLLGVVAVSAGIFILAALEGRN